jgi:hypothetical protein
MRPASRAGISVRFERCAPTATNTASKPPSATPPRGPRPVVQLERPRPSRERAVSASSTSTRQPVRGDAEVHHAAGDRAGVADLDRVAEAPQVVARPRARSGRRRPRAPGAPTTARRGQRPALFDGEVAQEALDGVDADRAVEPLAVAGRLARVVADAAVDGRERVGLEDGLPRLAVAAGLREGQPRLDRLAPPGRRACTAAQVEIDGPPQALGTVRGLVMEIGQVGQVGWAITHAADIPDPSCYFRASMLATS